MPKGYMLVEVTVHDPAAYEVYRRQVMATVEAYGGRFLVRGGPAELVEGSGAPGRGQPDRATDDPRPPPAAHDGPPTYVRTTRPRTPVTTS